MANPTQVNIGIGLDMDALKKSVGLARGEVETFVRDIKKQQTDLATFNTKAAAADKLFTQGSISAQEHATAIAGLAKQYNQIGERGEAMFGGIAARLRFNEEALARTIDKQKQGLAMLELQDRVLHNMGVEQEKIVQAHIKYAKELGVTSPLMQKMAEDAKRLAAAEQESATFIANIVKTRIAMEQEKHAKAMADIAAEKSAEENSMIFLMELRKQQRLDEEQRHAKKVADIAAEKLAEENSMIFLMELRKQQRLDEEQRHAKKVADLAAEKLAEENSLIFLMNLNKTRIAMEQEAHAKKVADIAAEKKAEEDSMIFRHELLKQIRLDEEQRHATRMSQIAAEKQSQQTLGTNIYGPASPASRAQYSGLDPATGKVIEQKRQELSLDEAINKLENDHQADVRRHAEQNAAREKQLHQEEVARKQQLREEEKRNAQLHSDAMRRRQNEQRQADRDRLRSLIDQTKSHQQIVAESDRFLERMKKQYNLSDALLKKLKEIERLRLGGGGGGGSKHGESGSHFKSFAASQLQSVAGGMLAGFGAQALLQKASDFIADSAKLAIAREQIVMAMTALTNSAAAANDMVVAFKRLDQASALTFMQIGKGAQTMLGFGVSQEMLMSSLSALSEISMGNAERFQSLSLALGQVAASGKLAGQEILQMVNAGFNPLQEISRRTGRTMTDLRAATSAGEISFAMVADAIIASTESGGRFNDMNEKYLETIGGQISKFQSDMELFKTALGESFMPLIRQFVDLMKEAKNSQHGIGKAFTQFSDGLAFDIALLRDIFTVEAFTDWPSMMKLLDDILERNRDAAFQLANEARGPEPVVDRAAMMARQKAETDISNLMMTTTDILAKEREELNKLIYSEEQLLATRLKLTEENTKSANESMLSLLEKDKQKTELQKRREASQRAIDAIDAALSGDPEAGLGGIKKHLSDQILQLNELGKKGGSVAEMDALAKRRKDLEQELGNVQQEINRRKKGAADEFEREFSRNRRETIRKDMEKLDAEIAKLGAEATPEQLQRAKDYKKNLEEQERKAQEAIQLSKTKQEIAGLRNLETLQERLSLLGDMIADDKITLEEGMSIRENLIKENEEEQKKRRKEFEKFGLSMSPMEEAIVKFRDIIIAEREGFMSAADAMEAKLKIAEGIAKDQQVSLENPKMMDFGQAMQQAWKNTKIAMQQQKTNQILQQIDTKAGQMVNGLNGLPRVGARG